MTKSIYYNCIHKHVDVSRDMQYQIWVLKQWRTVPSVLCDLVLLYLSIVLRGSMDQVFHDQLVIN